MGNSFLPGVHQFSPHFLFFYEMKRCFVVVAVVVVFEREINPKSARFEFKVLPSKLGVRPDDLLTSGRGRCLRARCLRTPAGSCCWGRAPSHRVPQRILATVAEDRHHKDAHLFDLPGPSVISAPCNHGDQAMGWIHVVLLKGLGLRTHRETHVDTHTNRAHTRKQKEGR